MLNLRPFQIILLGIFAGLAIIGLVVFALFRGWLGEENPYGDSVIVWGTLDRQAFAAVREDILDLDKNFSVVDYVEKDPRTFESELLNAIAEGRSPDLVVLPSELLVSHRAKLMPIPYETLSRRTFRDTYTEGSEIFQLSDGTYGMPFAVDPLVMYWNRDILSSSGLARPPRTWEELTSRTTPAVAITTSSLDITRSAVAFGEYANVHRAKEVLLMLLLQAGSGMVAEGDRGGYEVLLNHNASENAQPPAVAALNFYTEFSNTRKGIYSWNRSLPRDREFFLAGDLALYFGYGSEFEELREGNPNLNFDAAMVPQGSGATILRDYGTVYAFSIPRVSNNRDGAYLAMLRLTQPQVVAKLTERLGLAPAHRSIIAGGSSDPFRQVLLTSALIAHSWLDPHPASSDNVFRQMVEDITSGRVRGASESVGEAADRLELLFR